MEYRDDFSNAESAAIEAYTSMAVRHTMLLLLGIATMMASILAIVLAAVGTVLDLAGVADLHPAFTPVAVFGLVCGGVDFIARRRDNDDIAGLATIGGQGALTTAGVVALLGWFSSGAWVLAGALAVGATTSAILFKYPEWETRADMLERFVRVPDDGDDDHR
ncbi:hypothetical protein CLV30_11487 [Haloactinopolyspora alba]|uniref:Uncharacterized protein n=1 Tax=Haloactinopolyspora alba TaxID=648780 RepID=A0A2P8DW15_9ACTN|nr:hypothetical protein [Haloactinopolyspora alba]PSL01357.1 hypothetical protein CLV30_11487 [Haloactinopolyspora alba]